MIGNKKVSVIVPIYNVERYIDKCVKSLMLQDYSNIEIILVDDGSPDNSGRIIDELSKEDNRIIVIHKANGGVSTARNAGLLQATGEYVMFLTVMTGLKKTMYRISWISCKKTDCQSV